MVFLHESITAHDNTKCESCKGAAAHHRDHYALGALRIKIAQELGLTTVEGQQQPSLGSLLEQWYAMKSAYRDKGEVDWKRR